MRSVGAEDKCAESLQGTGGLVPSTHKASYHDIY